MVATVQTFLRILFLAILDVLQSLNGLAMAFVIQPLTQAFVTSMVETVYTVHSQVKSSIKSVAAALIKQLLCGESLFFLSHLIFVSRRKCTSDQHSNVKILIDYCLIPCIYQQIIYLANEDVFAVYRYVFVCSEISSFIGSGRDHLVLSSKNCTNLSLLSDDMYHHDANHK
mmetsp:Transcript_5354/g.7556  ORF Transcript_5354/g.7556 Transcript_5354/m.7556 type:complete len:171 (+) Transcript_5354:2379-2891(+)